MCVVFCFFFNDTATTEIYTLSLHDALPISLLPRRREPRRLVPGLPLDVAPDARLLLDRKSTRLNSSHSQTSYAVFCLKKKTNSQPHIRDKTYPPHLSILLSILCYFLPYLHP